MEFDHPLLGKEHHPKHDSFFVDLLSKRLFSMLAARYMKPSSGCHDCWGFQTGSRCLITQLMLKLLVWARWFGIRIGIPLSNNSF